MTVEQRWKAIEGDTVGLSAPQLSVLAAASAQRCAKRFADLCARRTCEDPSLCDEVVESAWNLITSHNVSPALNSFRTRLEKQAVALEADADPMAAAGAEACYACMVLIEIVQQESTRDQVNRIVRLVRDITDLEVQESGDFQDSNNLEQSILEHPIMKNELKIFERLLKALRINASIEEIRALAR